MTAQPIHFGTVETTERLTPRMVRVRFGGPGLDAFEPTEYTDQYVKVDIVAGSVSPEIPFDRAEAAEAGFAIASRRYTVRAWDPTARCLSMDFVTHGDVGLAGRWASRARPGDRLQFTGPSGSFRPDPGAAWHLMIGDESALPAIAASIETIRSGAPVVALLAVDDAAHELDLDGPEDLRITWVHRCDADDPSEAFVKAVTDAEFPAGTPSGFVHGEAREVRAIRKHLLGDRGIDREALSLSPYWRRGDTDESWRAVKRDFVAEMARDLPESG